MFRFFYDRKWWPWSIGGTITIVLAVWYSVQLDVQINEWFGRFYDALQLALSKPGALTIEEFNGYMLPRRPRHTRPAGRGRGRALRL